MNSSPPRAEGPAVRLRLDWCDHAAAKYAVERWYYRSEMPRGKVVRVGVWEDDRFCGVVLFGMGSSGDLGKKWGLGIFECCEMVRVAMGAHRSPVSRVVSIAIRMLKKQSPGLRAVVSYSDPAAGHVGTIYQAMNWAYTGKTAPDTRYVAEDGTEYHSRAVDRSGFKKHRGVCDPCPRPQDCRAVKVAGKHRYVYPLDDEVRARLQATARPYPKKSEGQRAGSDTCDTPANHAGKGGSLPTPALTKPRAPAARRRTGPAGR